MKPLTPDEALVLTWLRPDAWYFVTGLRRQLCETLVKRGLVERRAKTWFFGMYRLKP